MMMLVRGLRTTRISTRTVVFKPSSLGNSSRLTAFRWHSSSRIPSDTPDSPSVLERSPEQSSKSKDVEEPRYSITFTCTVPNCGERTSHLFTKNAYHNGIVIIQCPGCKNRHLIADNLGWFKDERTGEGTLRNIEDMMRAKGQNVKRGRLDVEGVVEYSPLSG